MVAPQPDKDLTKMPEAPSWGASRSEFRRSHLDHVEVVAYHDLATPPPTAPRARTDILRDKERETPPTAPGRQPTPTRPRVSTAPPGHAPDRQFNIITPDVLLLTIVRRVVGPVPPVGPPLRTPSSVAPLVILTPRRSSWASVTHAPLVCQHAPPLNLRQTSKQERPDQGPASTTRRNRQAVGEGAVVEDGCTRPRRSDSHGSDRRKAARQNR